MKTQFLLPHSFKLPGIIMMLVAIAISIVAKYTVLPFVSGDINVFAIYSSGIFENSKFFQTISANILFTFFNFVFITGVMMAAFARLKNEDEYISKLRLESLVWAVYANFIIILLANFAIYGTDFMDVLIINMYTIPVLFLLRFNYVVYKTNKLAQNEN